jgi:hypothetical protein
MGKLSFLAGAAVGYVLGAKAGRKRYEQIKTQAGRVWKSDPVQARVSTAAAAVKQQAAPLVTQKLNEAVKAVGQQLGSTSSARGPEHSAGSSSPGEQLPESIHRDSNGNLHADTSGYGPGGAKLP